MLADGVEASVRSLSSRDEAAIRAMVARIIDERLADGQFDECDLTLRDIERIREAFVAQLLGMYHQRIAYPQNKVVELESRGRRPAPAAGGAADRARDRSRGPIYLPPVADRRRRSATASRAPLAAAVLARAVAARARRGRRPAPGVDRADPVRRRRAGRRSTGRTWASDGPTDVLSFPLLPPEAFPPHRGRSGRAGASAADRRRAFACPPGRAPHLGDIVVSVERAVAQADEGRGGQTGDVRWSPADELRLLVTHGALHVCGWDHADPAEEAAMRGARAAAAGLTARGS